MNIKDYILFFLTILVITMLLLVYIKQPSYVQDTLHSDIQKYKDSIAKLDSQISFHVKKISTYEKTIDSLNSLPAKIKIKYRDQKASVPSATVNQLDSIIRANAGLPQR